MNERPSQCEPWCASHGYEDCTCDLDERQARWDREHRSHNATELPRAAIVRTKRESR